MLRVALSEVRSGAVETAGEIGPADLHVAEAGVSLLAPLEVRGRFSAAGEGRYYWRASVRTAVREECRRCLTPVDIPMQLSLSLVFSAVTDIPDDEGCYLIPPRTQVLDLTAAVREEFLLALPQFVECRPECRGLCPRCGANLNEGPCGCPPAADPRWDALRALT
jgi:uncharacterized protein